MTSHDMRRVNGLCMAVSYGTASSAAKGFGLDQLQRCAYLARDVGQVDMDVAPAFGITGAMASRVRNSAS